MIDVGTGAGFPGIPLKIVLPGVSLTLLDSLQKRVAFLQEVCSQLGLQDVTCIHGRAEELGREVEYRENYDVAVSRAVAPLPVLLEYCSGFVRQGGLFLAYKGPSIVEELEISRNAVSKLQFSIRETMDMVIPDTEYRHFITIFEKIGSLPLEIS
ncbi:MAG: 16S rRNA (guanine(527)-N(7))-methyltransferase RsmG [Clostridia bacterium]